MARMVRQLPPPAYRRRFSFCPVNDARAKEVGVARRALAGMREACRRSAVERHRGGSRCLLPTGPVPVEMGLKTNRDPARKEASPFPIRRLWRRMGKGEQVGKGKWSALVLKRGFHRHKAGGDGTSSVPHNPFLRCRSSANPGLPATVGAVGCPCRSVLTDRAAWHKKDRTNRMHAEPGKPIRSGRPTAGRLIRNVLASKQSYSYSGRSPVLVLESG